MELAWFYLKADVQINYILYCIQEGHFKNNQANGHGRVTTIAILIFWFKINLESYNILNRH